MPAGVAEGYFRFNDKRSPCHFPVGCRIAEYPGNSGDDGAMIGEVEGLAHHQMRINDPKR